MQLRELFLNRFLFRDNAGISDASPLGSDVGGGGSGGGGSSSPANSVAPGTVIQSALIQSSGSDDRIEINPDDTFRAYTDGEITTQIDRNGIFATNASVVDSVIINLEVDDISMFDPVSGFENVSIMNTGRVALFGEIQPVLFDGVVIGSLGLAIIPAGWTLIKNGTGDYTINYDTTNWPPFVTPYNVTCSPGSGHFRYQIYAQSITGFSVSWQESTYGTTSFPVSGGGGGSVSVVGVYQGEALVDVLFRFTVSIKPNL